MASTHDETDILGSSPMKKRRGRPSLKKNLPGGVIGESTIPMALNSSHQQSAHELSEATAKQGFCSTPVMRLSPSKDNRLGQKSATKTKSKAVLYEINNANGSGSRNISVSNGGSTGKGQRKVYNEVMLVSSTFPRSRGTEPVMMATKPTGVAATPQKTPKLNGGANSGNPSTLSSSSPLSSNILTSDPIHQSSSPLQTSPLPSEYSFHNHHIHIKNSTNAESNANEKNSTCLEEKPIYSVQSSPFYNTTSRNYDDQIFKYINSSPISTANTPKRRGFDHNMSLDSVMRMQRGTGRVSKNIPPRSPALATPTSSSVHSRPYRQQPYRYRLSYRYKLTLDIDDYGKAKIYARVIENNMYTPSGVRYYDSSLYEGGAVFDDNEPEDRRPPRRPPRRISQADADADSDSDSDMENYEPSRYEQYLSEQREYNEQRQQVIRNSMKSDPYMTECYVPMEYMSAASSPMQRIWSSRSHPNNLHGQLDFEDYINQEYERVKTVNINYVVNNSYAAKGLSAGIEVDPAAMAIGSHQNSDNVGSAGAGGCYPHNLHLTDQQHALRDELGRVSHLRKSKPQLQGDLDKIRRSPDACAGNDALAALRDAVLS